MPLHHEVSVHMNVFFGLDSLPQFRNAVVTIGTFDGVHVGHQAILDRLKSKAKSIDGETVIITFEPHPRFVLLGNSQPIFLLNTLEEKIRNIERQGIDNLVVVNFTLEFAAMEAEAYVKSFLVENFQPHTLIIGYDHLFGKGRKGNFQLLQEMKTQFHFELEEIPMQVVEQNKISSTQIRLALKSGDVAKAARYLGQAYALQGVVIEGKKRGKNLGYPTANIQVDDGQKLIPAIGVYAVRVEHNQKLYGGMMNIGHNPTFADGKNVSMEVHIFDFDQDIYGMQLKVFFMEKLRDEMKFDGVQELVRAIDADKVQALKILANPQL